MKAQKVTVKIKIQALSYDSVPDMLNRVSEQLQREMDKGRLKADDGDEARWTTRRRRVKF